MIIFAVILVFFLLGLAIGFCIEQPKYNKAIDVSGKQYAYRLRMVQMLLESNNTRFNRYLSTDPVNEDLLVGILEQQEYQIEQIKSLIKDTDCREGVRCN